MHLEGRDQARRSQSRDPGAAFSKFQIGSIKSSVCSVSRDSIMDDVSHQPYFAAEVAVDRASIPEEINGKLTGEGGRIEVASRSTSGAAAEVGAHRALVGPDQRVDSHAWG
jgi:hypothetical protein